MIWNKVDTVRAPSFQKVWIFTRKGVVATATFVGWAWSVDAQRIIDDEDTPQYWAEITYPEGPKA